MIRTNVRIRRTWSAAACTLALMALTAGIALAATPSTTAYRFSSHPMISGTVVTVNDHQMVVNTDQGEQVTLEVDSRTMAPRDLAPGMVMRIEFLALEDCHFYAQRIMAIRDGMSLNRTQAYANTRDRDGAYARNVAASDAYRAPQTRENQLQAIDEHSPGTVMTATPTTADYQFSTRSLVSGRVISANDHLLVVATDQGQAVALVMDSRTMVPGEVEPGSIMRAEFTPLKDGRYYAKRISRIGGGVAGREQAYANTRDSDLLLAQNISDCGFMSAAPQMSVASVVERREPVAKPARVVVAESAPASVVQVPETLPQTASSQPLILLLGFLAIGAAGALAIGRHLYAARVSIRD